MTKLGLSILTIIATLAAVSAVKNGRVTGGGEVKLGVYPWQAAIYYDDIYICAGSLITKKHILTTGNCLKPYEFYPQLLNVHLGVLIAADAKNKRTGIKISYADPTINHFDVVAVLEMDKEVVIGSDITAVSSQLTEKLQHLDNVKLSGWGMDDESIYYLLHGVDLKLEETSSNCKVDASNDLCTYAVDANLNKVGPCKWDEGSGLIKYEVSTDDHILIGVVKHTNKCSDFLPIESRYISTEAFKEFIAKFL